MNDGATRSSTMVDKADYDAVVECAERMVEALQNATLHIEYLHDKFAVTGIGEQVLANIEASLAAWREWEKTINWRWAIG